MLPADHRSLLIADTARAEQWRDGLAAQGLHPLLAETRGDDADKGAWYVTVPDAEAMTARGFVTDVLAGRARLPGRLALAGFGRTALLAIGILIAAFAAVALLALR